MRSFLLIVSRDLQLATRIGGGGAMAVGFFVIAATLYPLALGPELSLLGRIAPGIIWVSALLACLLSLDRLFQADHEDGTLDLLLLDPLPLPLVILAKTLAHWLTTGLPLIIAAPVLALTLNLGADGFVTLLATMLLGTPSLSLLGAVGAALTVGIRRGGMLLTLLVLPLYIPLLIFAVSAMDAALFGLGASAQLLVLTALLLAAIALCPVAAAAALRLYVQN
jgi:heme exporter protein B